MKVPGKALMIRIAGSTVALATSCTVDLTLQTINARTKSDKGAYEVGDYIAYSISCEALMGMNASTPLQQTQAKLAEIMLAKAVIDVEVMLAANARYALPGGDWIPGAMKMRGFQSYGGQALIKQLSMSGGVGEKAKLNIQLGGVGELHAIDEPALESRVEGSTLYVTGPVEVDGVALTAPVVNVNDNILEL